MLLNRLNTTKLHFVSNIQKTGVTNRISFTGKYDSFETRPEVVFGDIKDNEIDEIVSTVEKQHKLSSGWTSDVFKYGDKIIKVPSRKTFQSSEEEQLFKGQNLREYFVLDKINQIDSTIATKPEGIIRNKDSYYLVEELINGKHPKGNHLSKRHLEDLLSKFIKLDSNGITNCDLQSGNIFLTNENKTKLIDFGSYNYIFNTGLIVGSDYLPSDMFKPNGAMFYETSLDNKTRFLKTFLQDNHIDVKSQADNPYLRIQSNATNFEYRTLYSHLLDNSEENPLEFYKTYLKTKALNYHTPMKNFLESLDFDSIDPKEFGTDKIASGKNTLKHAIDYEALIKEILSNPDDDVVKTELAKLQLRTFLNLGDSLKSPIENSKKLKSAYDQLIEVLNNGIKSNEGNKKSYFVQTLNDFEEKLKDYKFVDGQVEIPDNENLIKVLFKKQIQEIKEATPDVIKDNANNIQDNVKNSNKKLGIIVSIIAAVALGIMALVAKKKKNKIQDVPIQQNNTDFNNKNSKTQDNNISLLKNLPDTFKQFQR